MQFPSLLTNRDSKSHVSALAEGQLNSEDGTMVLLSGKVVEMNTKCARNSKVGVSLWIRQIDNDRCLAVAEPVERRIAQLVIDRCGVIISGDVEGVMLFQVESEDHFMGMDIRTLIPAIRLPDLNDSNVPKTVRKQKATGKTTDGISFPLCLMITTPDESHSGNDSGLSSNCTYIVTIWVFQNVSGLLVIDENGTIESCNHHFSMLMFGYSQAKILQSHITAVIPNFGQEFEYLGYGRSRNVTTSSLDESETETDPVYYEADQSLLYKSPMVGNVSEYHNNPPHWESFEVSKAISEPVNIGNDLVVPAVVHSKAIVDETIDDDEAAELLCNITAPGRLEDRRTIEEQLCADATELLTPVNETEPCRPYLAMDTPNQSACPYETADLDNALRELDIDTLKDVSSIVLNARKDSRLPVTSTPDVRRTSNSVVSQQHLQYNDGKYKGEALHNDGNVLDILYTISCQELPCGRRVYCVWVCRDLDGDYDEDYEDDDGKHPNLTLTFNSVNSTLDTSVGGNQQRLSINASVAGGSGTANVGPSCHDSMSLMSQCEDDQIHGDYSKHYTNLKQIGKGAYGYVKMAFRHTDRLLVITKFILKEKLAPQFMVRTDDRKEVPMEVYLLTTVKHPNIVSVLDVFENDKFYQMVMEKHGSGMDLFEFIDRRPVMDEALCCYIFRQIANAIDYLHSLKVSGTS